MSPGSYPAQSSPGPFDSAYSVERDFVSSHLPTSPFRTLTLTRRYSVPILYVVVCISQIFIRCWNISKKPTFLLLTTLEIPSCPGPDLPMTLMISTFHRLMLRLRQMIRPIRTRASYAATRNLTLSPLASIRASLTPTPSRSVLSRSRSHPSHISPNLCSWITSKLSKTRIF